MRHFKLFRSCRGPFLVIPAALLLFCGQLTAGQIGGEKWRFDTGGFVFASPAIGEENILYIPSGQTLIAINPDGTEKWSYDAGVSLHRAPVIAPDGTIYLGDNTDGKVIAVNVDGTMKWTFEPEVDGIVRGEMALAADGTLYAGVGSTVYAINSDGTEFWNFEHPPTVRGISIGTEGRVAVSDGAKVTLLDSLGNQLWSVPVTNGGTVGVIFGEDGTIYYAAREVGALNPEDGSQKWEVDVGTSFATPSTGTNGELYVPLRNDFVVGGGVVALNPEDGSEIWKFVTETHVDTTPAVGLDGNIYFGSASDELFAISSDGTLLWKFEASGDIVSSPTLAENGTLYFGGGNNFYALNTSSLGLAASSWAKIQRDVRNTGQLGSDVTRRRFFAPHAYSIDELNNVLLTMRHIGNPLAAPAGGGGPSGRGALSGLPANFRIEVRDRDGSELFSMEESVGFGGSKDILLSAPGDAVFQGSVIVDAPIKDGLSLAPFLTWNLDVSEELEPLRIGVFFSGPQDAAQVHYFPGEASETTGLGVAVQNIGENEISCTLDFVDEEGNAAGQEIIPLDPLGSFVGFFNDSVPPNFKGGGTFTCDAPVVAVAVTQDFANGGFPTDRVTIKGLN